MSGRDTYDQIVWDIVWQVPAGRVTTYGQIASMIPVPEGMNAAGYLAIAPRWVGYAMRRCMSDSFNNPPDPAQPSIPWHRVINSQGKISLAEGSYEAVQQRIRLEDEGVEFDKRGQVDLRRYSWDGPDEDWLKARHLVRPLSFRHDND